MAKGSEDVFLSLAQDDNSDEHEHDQFEDAREEHDDSGSRTYRLPGQYPSPKPNASYSRPKSSGQLLATQYNDMLGSSNEVGNKHIRHSSQPDRGKYISLNARLEDRGLGLSGSTMQSPRLETRLRTRNTYAKDTIPEPTRSNLSSFDRNQPTYTNGPFESRPRRDNGRDSSSQYGGRSDYKSQILVNSAGGAKPSSVDSDSADSQTAPSTVWDELDDLKSRLKKLEMTGKMPPSPGHTASGNTADRPRTATTAPTTISSSPRHLRKASIAPTELTVEGNGSATGAHALLQAALAKAKASVKPHLYRPLEAAATDAIALAFMSSGVGPQGTTFSAASIVNGASFSDRQIRRKAESMCRNLTDLCIALCDAKLDEGQPQSSPLSARKLHSQSSASPLMYARQSREPDAEDSSSVAGSTLHRRSRKSMSRLDEYREARGATPSTPKDSPEIYQTPEWSPSTTPTDYTARYAGTIRGNEARKRVSHIEEAGEPEPAVRPPSRAMTDAGSIRQMPSFRRDLLSTSTQRSPSLRETLAARRVSANMQENSAGSGAQNPASSGQTSSSRFSLDRKRGPPSETGSTLSSARRRTSIGFEPFSPSIRLGTPTMRNSSLSQRQMAAD